MTEWNKDNITKLGGKVIIVTGANSGLGYESSLMLAEKGAKVVMACRNIERGQESLEAIKNLVPTADLELIKLNLASLDSIRAFANTFTDKFDRLDVLINNGGVMGAKRNLTVDGFESQFGINHLGHFALTSLLLKTMLNTPSSRVVTVSSRMHVDGKMAWEDLMSEKSYDRWAAYRQSKLANLLFAFELGRRLDVNGSETRSIAVHPGTAATNWAQNNLGGFMGFLFGKMGNMFFQSAALGALSQLYAAVDAGAKNGGYYGPEHDQKGYPVETQASDSAYDEAEAKRLWDLSEELTGVNYVDMMK